MASWEALGSLAAAATAIGTALGFGVKNAKQSGATEEKVHNMRSELTNVIAIVTGHTAQIAEHDGSFKAIDVKLGYITQMIEKMSNKLDKHCEEKNE